MLALCPAFTGLLPALPEGDKVFPPGQARDAQLGTLYFSAEISNSIVLVADHMQPCKGTSILLVFMV